MKINIPPKHALLIGTLLFLLFFAFFEAWNFFSYSRQNDFKPQHFSFQAEKEIFSLGSKRLSAITTDISPFKQAEEFISTPQKSEFPFTSVGGHWWQESPNGTNVELQVRFLNQKGVWSDWLDLEEEEKGGEAYFYEDENLINAVSAIAIPGSKREKFAVASANESSAFQYKILLFSDGINKPQVQNLEWTFINTGNKKIGLAPTLFASAKKKRSDSGVAVISRANWGADESYRYLPDNSQEAKLIALDPRFYEKYKDELQYSRTVKADGKGDKYKWPLAYPEKVSKFIIHHSATTSNLENPERAVRDIYYFHSMVRGWGDIGYNYLIDQQGKIYEGRFGGEGVIGAHAGPGNHGSIGIALLGDYEKNETPEKAITSLAKLIGAKAKIHNIDPEGESSFRGSVRPNVFGHKDIMATSCPGKNLYTLLPTIRSMAAKFAKAMESKIFKNTNESGFITLVAGERKTVKIKLRNTSKKAWDKETQLRVVGKSGYKGVVEFPDLKSVSLAKVGKSVVAGGVAEFEFVLAGGESGGNVLLELELWLDGKNKADAVLTLPLATDQSKFDYEFVNSKLPPKTMKAGESFSGFVRLKNTGNREWKKNGGGDVALYSKSEPTKKIASLKENTVMPGETGDFIIKVVAPKRDGVYREDLLPVADGNKIKMADVGLFYSFRVGGKDSDLEDAGIENEASAATTKDLNFSDNHPIFIDRREGPTGLTASSSGSGRSSLKKDRHLKDSITSQEEKKIRVRLAGMQNIPEITANGDFKVYRGNKLLGEYKKGDRVVLNPRKNILRAVAGKGVILEIVNFEKRPKWNPKLNDNLFRDTLETRLVDDKIAVINELPLEDYLVGLGEVSNGDPTEKIKTIMVAARTYALFYMTKAEKFPGKPYNLDDDPNATQKYLGYSFELRSPNIRKAVKTTKGEVVTYKGELIKTPYFNQSDGKKTKSALEVWGWTDTPYLLAVDDSHCKGTRFLGHGVGLSGCGATAMAEAGKSYVEILTYYYQGTEVEKYETK